MHLRKARRKLLKGESITHKSWSEGIHLKIVVGQYSMNKDKEVLIDTKPLEYFLNYHKDYTDKSHRQELDNSWLLWEDCSKNKEAEKQLADLCHQKNEIEKEIEQIKEIISYSAKSN